MPELPEVETIRGQLAPVVEGCVIAGVEVKDPRWITPHKVSEFERALSGASIKTLGRRGKYLLLAETSGSTLVMHLRMTGNLLFIREGDPLPERHLRGAFWLESTRGRSVGTLAFTDPRRFGTAQIFDSTAQLDAYLDARLGPEPFDDEFDGAYLHGSLKGRRTPIKAILLDQKVVSGIGNIYADEALFRAGIAPRRSAARISRPRADRLAETIRDALAAGIDAKGASIDDFRDAYGVQGSFQDQFLVHRREGLPCPTCASTVVKVRCAGRGTYFCPACQK